MKTVMHFGVGALGRGLTIPMLKKSDCRVIIVDAWDPIIEAIKDNNMCYKLFSVDAPEGLQHQLIKVDEAYSLNKDLDTIKRLLRENDTVTTSVIRENVINVAKLIAECWNTPDADGKMVLLCENIENANTFFKGLLKECAQSEEQLDNLMKIKVPNTMVDRGCGKNPNDILEVITDEFIEICVDKKEVEDTGIEYVPAVDNIESVFARKRYLVNTYADGMAFLGAKYELDSFSSVLTDERVQNIMVPFMGLVKKALVIGFNMSEEEVQMWGEKYISRFTKQIKKTEAQMVKQSRPFDNIARNMLRKLNLDERFVSPLIILLKHGEDISSALPLINDIVKSERVKNNYTEEQMNTILRDMWCSNEFGEYLYDQVTDRL